MNGEKCDSIWKYFPRIGLKGKCDGGREYLGREEEWYEENGMRDH